MLGEPAKGPGPVSPARPLQMSGTGRRGAGLLPGKPAPPPPVKTVAAEWAESVEEIESLSEELDILTTEVPRLSLPRSVVKVYEGACRQRRHPHRPSPEP